MMLKAQRGSFIFLQVKIGKTRINLTSIWVMLSERSSEHNWQSPKVLAKVNATDAVMFSIADVEFVSSIVSFPLADRLFRLRFPATICNFNRTSIWQP